MQPNDSFRKIRFSFEGTGRNYTLSLKIPVKVKMSPLLANNYNVSMPEMLH